MREDFVLAEHALKLDRAHRLTQLCQERAVGARLEQARDLHGDGRAARDDAAMGDELQRRAPNRERIDAKMLAEALVLVRDQQVEIARIDVGDGRRQPPAPVGCRVGPQQASVAVDDDCRELKFFAQRRGTERIDPCGKSNRQRNAADAEHRRDFANASPRTRRTLFLLDEPGQSGRRVFVGLAQRTPAHRRAPASPHRGEATFRVLHSFRGLDLD